MNDLISQLIGIIKREEDVLEKFLDCLNRQKEHIVRNSIEDFDLTVKEEERIIVLIREIERERMELVKSIASDAGAPDIQLTLTRLIEINLGEGSDELKNLKKTLSGLVERIKKANRVNQYLIRRSLSFIQKNIDWFIDGGVPNTIYGADGSPQSREVSNLLVDKIL